MEEVRGVRGGGKEEKGKEGGKELRQHAAVGAAPFLELPAEGYLSGYSRFIPCNYAFG